MEDKKPDRREWDKLAVPHELSDLFYMVAKAKGYKRDQIHLFLYHILTKAYPDDTKHIAEVFDINWTETPPSDD